MGPAVPPPPPWPCRGALRQSLPSEKVPAAPQQSFPQGIKECSFSSWHLCPSAPLGGGKGGEESRKAELPTCSVVTAAPVGSVPGLLGMGRYASTGSLPGRHAHSRQWEKATGVRTSGPGGGNSLTGDLWTQRTTGDKAAEVAPGLSPHLFGV